MSIEDNRTSQGVKDWLGKVEGKLDSMRETVIRTESKLEAYSQRTGETEATLKSHDLRLNEVDAKIAEMKGGQRMLQWLGGAIGGLVLIGQLAVMILKS